MRLTAISTIQNLQPNELSGIAISVIIIMEGNRAGTSDMMSLSESFVHPVYGFVYEKYRFEDFFSHDVYYFDRDSNNSWINYLPGK